MPTASPSFTWQEAALAYGVLTVAAFLVTWIVTDVLHVGRTAYVAVLAGMVGVLGAWYLTASGTSLDDLVTNDAAWAVLAGLVVAALVPPLVRRLPGAEAPTGLKRARAFAWEDVVYGSAEGLLLAAYPVLVIWQATSIAGWTDTTIGTVAADTTAIVGSLFVILVHHLGYSEFRKRAARPKLAGALLTCGLQAVAFLFTGNVLAPVVAHIALHMELTMHGTEMPPAESAIGSHA
jgi:uncharacterized membrane protein YdcZ (DUF606 family)